MERRAVDVSARARGRTWPGLATLLIGALGLALMAAPPPVRTAASDLGEGDEAGEAGRGLEPDRVDAAPILVLGAGAALAGPSDDEGSDAATPTAAGMRAHHDLSSNPARPPNTEPPGGDADADPLLAEAASVATSAKGIPEIALAAYRQAAEADYPGCAVRWEVLAGIGRVESNHGRLAGSGIDADGTVSPHILGPRLDGSAAFARIVDTDAGQLDDDGAYDRAVGPMQFLPSSWRTHGHDATGSGDADPNNLFDAARSAVDHLCERTPGDYRNEDELRRALLGYNPSSAYVAVVTAWIDAYDAGDVATEAAPPPPADAPSTVEADPASEASTTDPPSEAGADPQPAPEPQTGTADPLPAPEPQTGTADPQPAPEPETDTAAADEREQSADDDQRDESDEPEEGQTTPAPFDEALVNPEALTDAVAAPEPGDRAAVQRLRGAWWALLDWCLAGTHADDGGCADAAADTLVALLGADSRELEAPSEPDADAAHFDEGAVAGRAALAVDVDEPDTLPRERTPEPAACDPTCREAGWQHPDVAYAPSETDTAGSD